MSRILPVGLVSLLLVMIAGLFLSNSTPLQASVSLPPRPTLTATPTNTPSPPPVNTTTPPPSPVKTDTPKPENLARILLVAGSVYEGAWTVVQWQDKPGMWHDVEGWQGHVRNGWIRWRVAPKDWGTGPFRWLVYDKAGGTFLASTASFTLPGDPNQTIWVAPMDVAQE